MRSVFGAKVVAVSGVWGGGCYSVKDSKISSQLTKFIVNYALNRSASERTFIDERCLLTQH